MCPPRGYTTPRSRNLPGIRRDPCWNGRRSRNFLFLHPQWKKGRPSLLRISWIPFLKPILHPGQMVRGSYILPSPGHFSRYRWDPLLHLKSNVPARRLLPEKQEQEKFLYLKLFPLKEELPGWIRGSVLINGHG